MLDVRFIFFSFQNFLSSEFIYLKDLGHMTNVNNCYVVFQENHALRELYLSHNKFQELGGEIFADGLGKC